MAAIHQNDNVEENSAEESENGRRRSGKDDFLELCKKMDHDGCDPEIPDTLRWPRYDEAMPPVDANQLLRWPSKNDVEATNLLSAAIYGEAFERSPGYHRNGNALLKGYFPFLTIDCIGNVLATYGQFAASFFALDDGLEQIYERFGVSNHRELRSLAQKKLGSLQFSVSFMSRLPVSDNGNLRVLSHEIVLISARGERRRRTTKPVKMQELFQLAHDPEIDANLGFEMEWLAFHMATPRQARDGDDATGGRPQHLRAAFPINHKPNAGWMGSFCLGRLQRPDGEIKPDSTAIQCLECLKIGRYTQVSRNDSRTHHIMDHLEKYHEDIHAEVKLLSEAVFNAYLDSL